MQAAKIIGIPDKREKDIDVFLSIPKKRMAVITVPDLLIPGISERV